MRIQWFPGHMTKAFRMMQDQLRQVDCIIYVLDSRAVFSCLNPKFEELIAKKPVLYVINKCDLAERADVEKWLRYFEERGEKCVAADSLNGRQRDAIVKILRQLNAEVIEKYRLKGAKKSVRAMVVGVPNTGKSTFINNLCGSRKTVTGNKAGVTRGKQWVSIADGVELLDTPGSLPPAFEDEKRALHLAFIGSVKDDVLDIEELAAEMMAYFAKNHTDAFLSRYQLDEMPHGVEEKFLAVATARGFILSGGRVDYARTARAVIDDFRRQKFGRIMLDLPEDILPEEE